MAECITEGYKNILKGLIQTEIERQSFLAIVDSIPICAKEALADAGIPGAAAAAKRKMAEPWGIEPIYVDSEGKSEKFSSLSALIKDLGLPMSGTVCDAEGTKCRATSAVDILRISGYTVSGDGEPRKKAEGGTKLTVYHPDALIEEPDSWPGEP